MRTLEVVHLTWVDSEALNSWTSVTDIREELKLIHTIGMLIHQGHEMYIVSSTYDPDSDHINAAIFIPVKCVRSVKTLSVVHLDED